jgi:hypothetical protein
VKLASLLALVAWTFACSATNAARLIVEPAAVSPNGVYVLYLHGESTVFNALGLSVKPDNGAGFLDVNSGNIVTRPRSPGDSFTYRNRWLDADPSEYPESRQWTLLGVLNTQNEQAFAGGPLGRLIDTSSEPGGKLFLANLKLLPGATATATLQLVNGVDTVHTQTLQFPIPEPGGLAITAFASLVAATTRRADAWRGTEALNTRRRRFV